MITTLIFQLLRYDIQEAQSLIETIIYESQRVYRDRLVDRQSQGMFDSMLYNLIKQHLKYPNKLEDTYFLSKVTQGQPSLIKGIPSMGRIGKADYI
jgi:hypothetical protein